MKRGFTLLELLIVIGILAVLATAAVLVLNPAELLRQARDSTRVADLTSLHKTVALYLTTIKNPLMDNGGGHCADQPAASHRVYSNLEGATSSLTTFPYVSAVVVYPDNVSTTISRAVDGSGWLPVNLTAMANSPLSKFPIDPVNATSTSSSTTYVYIYGCDDASDTWVITARLESDKYINTLGIQTRDGGQDDAIYEIGNAPKLQIL
ncbi:MAG: type II secretion system protein [bacterium]|nr:type II secretion system protein [bacterium]